MENENEGGVEYIFEDKPQDVIETTILPNETEDTVETDITHLYSYLKDKNYVDEAEFDGSEEMFETLIKTKQDKIKADAQDEFFNKLSPEVKELVYANLNYGVNVNDYAAQNVQYDYDLENIEHQKQVIRDYYYKSTNYDANKIERMVDRIAAFGEEELKAEALDAYDEIEKIAEAEKDQYYNNLEYQRLELIERQQQLYENITKEITTLDYIEDKRKQNLVNFMFSPSNKNDGYSSEYERTIAHISNNPKHLAQLAEIVMDYDVTKGLKLDSFKKRINTEAVQGLKERLNKKTELTPSGTQAPVKHSFNWNEFLQNQ